MKNLQKKGEKLLQQVKNYTSYLLTRPSLPAQKFVIFSGGRSGSTLLVSLLNSHSQIFCDNEILGGPLLFPRLYIDVCASKCEKYVYGFKLL